MPSRAGLAAGPLAWLRFAVPSLFTLGNLACGFLSIWVVVEDQFRHRPESMLLAASLILAGAVCDVLDGVIARLLGSTSEMGVELDSLADLVSAGLAPAFLVYSLFLREQGGIVVVLVPLWFAIAVALRLARFNAAPVGGGHGFAGMPSPLAGGFIATFVICYFKMEEVTGTVLLHPLRALAPVVRAGMMLVTILLGVLMVSTIPYPKLRLTGITLVSPRLFLALAAACVLGFLAIPPLMFLVFLFVALWGPVVYAYRRAAALFGRT